MTVSVCPICERLGEAIVISAPGLPRKMAADMLRDHLSPLLFPFGETDPVPSDYCAQLRGDRALLWVHP